MIKKTALKSSSVIKNSLKAAIYVRVSTEEQAKEGYSLSAQEETLTSYAKLNGYKVFKIYKDEGKSAKDIHHRPELQQLLKDAEKNLFNAVLVYKLDRFSRSLKDLILTIERLKYLGIDFVSLQDKIETASAAGKLMFHIISSFAEFERDIISERTKFGMIEKAKDGGVVTRAPYGYKIHEGNLVVDTEKSVLLIQMFNEFLNENLSLNALARRYNLTVKGILTILRNRAYVGEIKFNDSYTQSNHEPLLDKELFRKVQEKLSLMLSNRQNVKNTNILLKTFPSLIKNTPHLEQLSIKLTEKSLVFSTNSIIGEPIEFCTSILKEKGYVDIEQNKVLINADKLDILAKDSPSTYVYSYEEALFRVIDNCNDDINTWILDKEKLRIYMFEKNI